MFVEALDSRFPSNRRCFTHARGDGSRNSKGQDVSEASRGQLSRWSYQRVMIIVRLATSYWITRWNWVTGRTLNLERHSISLGTGVRERFRVAGSPLA